MSDEKATSMHIYCATTSGGKKGRTKRSTYLVQRTSGSNVINIAPMPMVSDLVAPQEVTINALRAGLTTEGEWKTLTRHSRIKVNPRKVATNATPRRSKPKSMGGESGVSESGHQPLLP
jgi:hypothetical protein